ncbi:methyltransferase [Acidocella aquatica]|uniref:Methyltransferase n=1 Tax=Acidocella aquatica TaxID=1922313 RepID=A0ABQ6A3L8_9PROT|nr:methyltransferase domain-containing protein [Acidocella aquatica]GLR66242.1 methyltransferase [Acidocella aquatica]
MENTANAAQVDYWNALAGQTWARFQAQLDRQIDPLGREAIRVLAPRAGERILDIGCGCGQTTMELAALTGAAGYVKGADISAPMLEIAKARPVPPGAVAPVFEQADAQVASFGDGAFDAAFSRFGVMFFADPVAAFANIRKALRAGGRLAFVCWRPFAENVWMRAPQEAAAPFMPESPPSDPTAPGPFAFADAGRLRGILGDAGFRDIGIEKFDCLIGGGDLEQSLELSLRVGPLGGALREHPELVSKVSDAVKAALAGYMTPQGVLMPAASWIVRAQA